MTTLVEMNRDGDVAVILVDNPPVNALSHGVRSGIYENLQAARDDASIKAIVIGCKGRTFIAGADITEFGKPPQSPGLHEVLSLLDEIHKPTVAAIHGTALGGGLEVALACHFRVATESAKLGLPEVKLGILPGAGGTQRLPRLVGAEEALKMIVSGDPIGAAKAKELGLIDELSRGADAVSPAKAAEGRVVIQDVVADACALARKVVAESRALIRVRDRSEKLVYDEKAFNEAAGNLTKRARGLEAPMACVESVRNALTLPFDEGMKRERELFHETGHRRSVQIPAAYLLRRTRGAESARHARHDQGARRFEGGGDRRGHDGRRHRHVLCQCRHSRHHHRDGAGARWIAASVSSKRITARRRPGAA